jgi:hypothetical protein
MAGIFKNISNSGGAIFRNTSNSGRGLFYGDGYIPPPETTTTTTTSTTTTTTSEYTTTTTTTTTTTSTTTTTTTAAPTYPRWSVTACPGSTQGPTVVAVGLEVGSVYSGPNGCFTVNSAFGTSTSPPGTYTLVADCNAAQCPQI